MEGTAHLVDVAHFFYILFVVLVAAKLAGELFERIGQPAVLGELVAGVVLGSSMLGVVPVDPNDPYGSIVHVMAEIGVAILLFEIGLETDLREMFRVGPAALAVALVGVTLPFAMGYLYWRYAPHAASGNGDLVTAAIFIGATLTATSVGITARVLSDLDRMSTAEARIIIGAAVIDDVLGLVILSVVSGVAAGASVTMFGIGRTLAVAVGFLVVAVMVGRFLAPRLFDVIVRMQVRYVLLVASVAFALGLAGLAGLAGSALIIGAFAAGLILSGTNQFDTIEHEVRPVASVFTPFFFVSVGASVNLALLNPTTAAARATLLMAAALTVLAILGKVAAGWAAPWVRFRRMVVGVGMVPRGEVGLIFAEIGRRSGVLGEEVFGAVLLMVMVTTFIAPPALKSLFASSGDGS
jgi:Kef-type K+ transport system membrane component KefB